MLAFSGKTALLPRLNGDGARNSAESAVGDFWPINYRIGMRSIFAAQMKSFSDRPLMAWVVNFTRQ